MLGAPCIPDGGTRTQVNVVPYLIDNPSIGFVQARWTFTNPEESYLTKAGPVGCFSMVPGQHILQSKPCSADNAVKAALGQQEC